MSLMGDIRKEQAAVRTMEILHAAYGIAYAIVGPDLTIRWHSESLGPLVDAGQSDLKNLTLADVLWEFVGADEMLVGVLKGRSPGFTLENVNRELEGGTIRYLTFRIAALAPAVPESGLLLIVEDTTEVGTLQQSLIQERNDLRLAQDRLTRVNKDLEQLNQMKSLFISLAAHDLRTPLTVIGGFAEILSGDLKDSNVEQREMADIIHSQSDRVRHMIDNLLDLDRIEQGMLDIQSGPCALDDTVSDVVNGLRPMALLRKQTIRLTLPSEPIALWADSQRVAQIVYNLVENAIKYTPQDGRVLVVLERQGDSATLIVTDDGPGIGEEEIANLFSLYYRGEGARGSKQVGTGLGLYIVRTFVEAHQGTVEVDSRPGRGTTFTVKLPIQTGT